MSCDLRAKFFVKSTTQLAPSPNAEPMSELELVPVGGDHRQDKFMPDAQIKLSIASRNATRVFPVGCICNVWISRDTDASPLGSI